jgi:hypothetical protein
MIIPNFAEVQCALDRGTKFVLRLFKTDDCVANRHLGRYPNEKERDQVCENGFSD